MLLLCTDPIVWVIKPQNIDFLLEHVHYLVPREKKRENEFLTLLTNVDCAQQVTDTFISDRSVQSI